jgi:hypothetical protein
MEGTSSADDMRLLQERLENRFSLPWVRIWFLGVGKSEEDGVMVRLQVISMQPFCRGQTLNSNL